MIKAIINKKLLIEKNIIQINRLLQENEEFELDEETELLLESIHDFAFAKYENNKIVELSKDEAKLKGLIELQENEVIMNNKIVRLEIFEKFENGQIIVDNNLRETYRNNKIITLKKERVELKKSREDFLRFDEDTTELDKRIEIITKELEKENELKI